MPTGVYIRTEEHKRKISLSCSKPKKDNIGYRGIHHWIRRQLGAPMECKHCNKEKNKYNWANIDHTYKRIVEDYVSLCVSCHREYDRKYNGYKGACVAGIKHNMKKI